MSKTDIGPQERLRRHKLFLDTIADKWETLFRSKLMGLSFSGDDTVFVLEKVKGDLTLVDFKYSITGEFLVAGARTLAAPEYFRDNVNKYYANNPTTET